MPALLEAAMTIARAAAEKILEVYATDFEVRRKSDQSPLTRADTASHDVICAGLERLTPGVPIISEEAAALPYATRKTWGRYWLVDPLDGTREFVKRNGEFTINIALVEDHYPVAGLVYVPVQRLCYHATRGGGACKTGADGRAARIRAKTSREDALVVAGSRSHGNRRQQAFISGLGDQVKVIAAGSSLKFCLVADGTADIYARFGPTSEWDTAAAQCIVEEAGGRVTDFQFTRLCYNAKESLLNPEFLVIADQSFDWRSRLQP